MSYATLVGQTLLGCVVFILVAFVVGVLRRRAGLRDAQALAPGDFVFRFSTYGRFGHVLPKLPRSMSVTSPTGTSRVGALSASSNGIVLWQVKTRLRLAALDWSAVAAIRASSTTYNLVLSSRSYPTVVLEVFGESDLLTVPLLSANSHYFLPRTSTQEVQQIADNLQRLRSQGAVGADRSG